MPKNLDGQAGRRSHNLTRGLKQIIDSKMLWDDYGIDDDITVRRPPLDFIWSHKGQAVHGPLPSCRHSRNVISWYPTSADQGNVPGPPRAMDWWLSTHRTRRDSRECYIGRYWSPVRSLIHSILSMWCTLTRTKHDRVAAAPQFPALRRFPQGRRFKQWTGDDSKALMKARI